MRFLILALTILTGPLASWASENPPMINIRELAPNIIVDMRYATTDNFTGKVLYPVAECFLNAPAAQRLARVQRRLEKEGYGLKVWDCYRPHSIQKKLWKIVPDTRYVANPKTGSRHNRGASVDVTLVDKFGNDLPMPTDHDEFGKKGHSEYMDLPKEAIQNRTILRNAMEAEGFMGIATEWWHFDDPEWEKFALRDEPLTSKALRKDIHAPQKPPIPKGVQQLVVVTTPHWDSSKGILRRYVRKGKKWKEVKPQWPIVIGSNGMAWGHGTHIPTGDGPNKKEGDNRAPAGTFEIGRAYGYAAEAPAGTQIPYEKVDRSWRCIDDPLSVNYNLIQKVGENDKRDWTSAEYMRRKDALYTWVINIKQNYPVVRPGGGSCIFFHVWRRTNSVTRGCTAMKEEHMVDLLQWLDPAATPHLVQLPKPIYKKLRNAWKLP